MSSPDEAPLSQGPRFVPMPVHQVSDTDEPTPRYANTFGVLVGAWDFSLLFGRSYPLPVDPQTAIPGQPPTVANEGVAHLTFSPEHAKAFAKALTANVEQYEQQFGPIPDVDITGMPTPTEQDGA